MNAPHGNQVNESACDQLEQSWFSGSPITIEACLATTPADQIEGTTEELVCIEMEFAWKRSGRSASTGKPADHRPDLPTSIEEYLQRFPQLNTPQRIGRLITEELTCQLQVEAKVDPQDYHQRFPEVIAHNAELQSRLQDLEHFDDTDAEHPTQVTAIHGSIPPPAETQFTDTDESEQARHR